MEENNNNNNINENVNQTVEDAKASLNELNNTADTTEQYDPQDIQNNKFMAILSYIAILWLVPLLGAKESAFARFHANQGIIFFILCIVVNILRTVLIMVLGNIGGIIGWGLYLVTLALFIIGVYNAGTGKAKELPVIGGIKILS